ncbi:hypothetical protein [Brevundimonas sp. R86498]|uniref:hypothetical protein n=1 Tax=Brevundimonas sp. R86498 TaxID=3093845 RepID=UPI0037C8A3A2
MGKTFSRGGLAFAAVIAAGAVLSSCSKPEPVVIVEAPPPPPPVTLNAGVAEAASIYVAFIRDVGTIQAGFQDAESIQAAMRKGAAYDPATLSRGMIAYASILALQSPEFVAGVRRFADDPGQRAEVVANLIRDPAYAVTLPGADAAAGLIIATLGQDIATLTALADSVEQDAYTIQERNDPRRRWAVTPIPSREVRLESVKTISAGQMLPSAEDSARLFAAANSGTGLNLPATTQAPPYTPAVVNALAIAALAAMGAAGDEARANTEALSIETNAQFCLDMSKLNLFQCLAASRPSYEDMFCVGRHIVRDLATCTTQATIPVVADPAIATASISPVPTGVAAEAATASLVAVQPASN